MEKETAMTTGLIRFNPEADLFRGRMDRLFNQMLNASWSPALTEDPATRGFVPAVDVRETPGRLTIVAELPGLEKKDVQVTIENRVLTLSGERSFAKETENETLHRIERRYGSFSRTFTLPNNLRADQVEAKFDNGVLTIQIPKAEETKPRKVEIA
jgi:HSP20 family protein